MVVAEALDFPGAVTQGFDLPDARLMIASALEDLAQCLLEEGKPLPTPDPEATSSADLIELVPVCVPVWRPSSLKRHALIGRPRGHGCRFADPQNVTG